MSPLAIFAYVALAVGVVAVVAAVVLVVLQRRKKAKAEKAAGAAHDLAKEVREAFAAGRALFAAKVIDAEQRASTPRFLMLGEPGSGKTTLLRATGLHVPFGQSPAERSSDTSACNFWLLGRGLVIDVAGRLLVQGDDAEPPERDGFHELLDGLRRDRPARPLDGILLSIPCREILPTSAEMPEERKRKAATLRARIVEAQRALEMCAPIYIVITQCDLVTGFGSFANELDPELRQTVLGWSSPSAPGASVSPSWVDDAFASLARTFVREQSRRFAGERSVREADEFFLFPSEMAALSGALRAYVEEIFAPSANDDPLSLRGIYFTGDGGALVPAASSPPSSIASAADPSAPQGPPAPALASSTRPIVFARDLFERKIFPEGNIARPSARAIKRRQRIIVGLQIASVALALLFGGLLALESGRLERETSSLMPFLAELSSDVLAMKSEERHADPTGETRAERATHLFRGLSAIETNRLRSALIPGSWLSSIDGRVANAVSIGYERVILDAFLVALKRKAGPITTLEATLPSSSRVVTPTLEKAPEFQRLEDWLRDLGTFEANVSRYDGLLVRADRVSTGGSESQIVDVRVQDVTALAAYLLGHKVEPSYKASYYRSALARGATLQPFALEPHRAPAHNKADKLFEALHRRLLDIYNEESLRADLRALAQGLLELEAGGPEYTPLKLWKLRDAIGRAEADLAAPVIAWVSGDALPQNPGLGRVLEAVQTSRLLGPEMEQSLKAKSEEMLGLLKNDVTNARTARSSLLLAHKDNVVLMQLSPFIQSLKAPIDALRAQSFMGSGDDGVLPDDGDDARIAWDVDVLKETAKMPKEYEAYLQAGGIKAFPNDEAQEQADGAKVQDTIKGLTERTLRAKVLGGIAKAAGRGGGSGGVEARALEAVRTDVQSFAQASVTFREILASLARLKMNDERDRVRRLLRSQGGRLLRLALQILESPSLYEVRDGNFNWWNGEGVPALEAFGAADVAGLAEYVNLQRTRAELLSKDLAEPTLSVMNSPEVAADGASVVGMQSWERVVSPLHDYAEKKAGNSVSALERFIIAELPAVTFESCLIQLERAAQGLTAGDYFSEKRRRIRSLLRDRCVELAHDDIRDRYAQLRRVFNRDLQGRFPFQRLESGTKIDDASADATRRFFHDAEDFTTRYRGVLSRRRDASAISVVRFLDKVKAANAFLAPVLSQSDAAADGFFDVKVDFRVNQLREVGGNHVAAWSMKFAEERLLLGGPKASSRFRLGDPVRLELRWAKNGPDLPASTKEPNVTVKDREVSFEERGTWALLRMIAGHQISSQDVTDGEGAGGNVLLFVVRTIPDPSGGFLDRVGADAGVARVFIRLGLSGGEKDKALKYPDFPQSAPTLN